MHSGFTRVIGALLARSRNTTTGSRGRTSRHYLGYATLEFGTLEDRACPLLAPMWYPTPLYALTIHSAARICSHPDA